MNNYLEESESRESIIYITATHGLLTSRIAVYRSNIMKQIVTEYANELQLNSLSQRFIFTNERTRTISRDWNSSVEDLDLIDEDTLQIDDGTSPDATIVSHFGIVNNTHYRTLQNIPNGKENYHELVIASSSNSSYGHGIAFYIKNSTLHDIIAPYMWLPKWVGCENSLTGGKKVRLIVNERNGKCAKPSEFDMLISTFVGSEKESGRLFVILEDENIAGMHLDSFSFGE